MTNDITHYQDLINDLNKQKPSSETAQKWIKLAKKWHKNQRLEKVILCYSKAFEYFKTEQMGIKASEIAILIGHAHRELGHNRDTRRWYQQALTQSEVPDKQNQQTALCYFHLATLAQQTWNLSIAINQYEKSKEIYNQLNLKDHVNALEEKINHLHEKSKTFKK